MPKQSSFKDVLQAHFRANPGYELVLFDRLPEDYRKQLADLTHDADFYGVLWPHAPGLALKSVDQKTALLFLTLQHPGPTPAYVQARLGEQCNQAMAALVLDGVLEITQADRENFVSGAAAHSLIFVDQPLEKEENRISRLSTDALRYAQALDIVHPAELAARLDRYNTVPASPAWQQRLFDPEGVLDYLGLTPGSFTRQRIDSGWTLENPTTEADRWLIWRARRKKATGAASPQHYPYQLYISPQPDVLPGVLDKIIETLSSQHIQAFKIGRDMESILRPDKLVVYCQDFEELARLGQRLQKVLTGCLAQGVPFSAGIDAAGLLSWGMDPFKDDPAGAGLQHNRWRTWLTHHLAEAIITAKAQAAAADMPADFQPWQAALERLQSAGVDTSTWSPRPNVWRKEQGG